MIEKGTICQAMLVCIEKHGGQRDKNGEPYYLHPFAVANKCSTLNEKIVAYLHDVIEDTDMTLDELRNNGFDGEVVEAVSAITRQKRETYAEYIERVSSNRLAANVKISDLKHNLDPTRPGATSAMRRRYRKALAYLSERV